MHEPQLSEFGRMPDGTAVRRIELRNDHGLRAGVLTLGGILRELWAPDRTGRLADVVLGAASLAAYRGGFPAPGAVIGRVANRIAHARFRLEGTEYRLPANDGEHHLHGGPGGFGQRVWQVVGLEDRAEASWIELLLVSPDGDQGYPGAVTATVRYGLTDGDELRLEYRAQTDRPTPLNLTSHAYFNLSNDAPDVRDHVLWLDADRYTPVDAALIPTGAIEPVEGTPFDFRTPRRIGERLRELDPFPGGYDHNLVLRAERDREEPAAWLLDPASGRRVTLYTTEPAIQLYSGNFLPEFTGLGGRVYHRHGGLCLETQHFPDSVNQPAFPSILASPERPYRSATIFHFEVAS